MTQYGNRIRRARALLDILGIETLLITSPKNVYYYSGYRGTNGTIILTRETSHFITDFRYAEEAGRFKGIYEIRIIVPEMDRLALISCLSSGRTGFEDEEMPFKEYSSLRDRMGADFLVPVGDVLTKLRSVKNRGEIDSIRRAAGIADEAFSHMLSFIKPGMTEVEVAVELECFMRRSGGEKLSFDSIVASGKRSSLPHGGPTGKAIEPGDFLTLDFGTVVDGYCSDMTRTVVVGRASERQKEIYAIVLQAQEAALTAIRPGVYTNDIDTIARNIIKSNGYENYFGHGLGHGVGIEIHELPLLNTRESSNELLMAGMVITDEPGIYIPDFGGVRIEDLVLVTENGCEILSKSPKTLIEL